MRNSEPTGVRINNRIRRLAVDNKRLYVKQCEVMFLVCSFHFSNTQCEIEFKKKESIELATPYMPGLTWQNKNEIISNSLGAHAKLNNFIKARSRLKLHCVARTESVAIPAQPPQ